MAEKIEYKYCLPCKKRYKSGTVCAICGGVLSDTPTGASRVASASPTSVSSVSEPAPTYDYASSASSYSGEWTCGAKDVVLCLLHNILSGIPVIGLIWCLISVVGNPMKGRVSKGTVVAGLLANILSVGLIAILAMSK